MKKECWAIHYHHTFMGDVIEGTFADAVRAGIAQVKEDFGDAPLVVRTGYGAPGIDFKEEILTFESPLDLIASIKPFDKNEYED